MSRRPKDDTRSTMLDLWRPPRDAGEAVGCLATTYVFTPGLFDEQCLGRFLDIESEPQRESLAYLLERERRLGAVYAGVLVDASEAGVQHSLRWDVLPVRIPGGKQHAKVSLLAWEHHVRLIVASANLTEPGYRSNFEVAAPIDFAADSCDTPLLAEAIRFLRSLMGYVPGGADLAESTRAESFLRRVETITADWKSASRGGIVRHRLACTLPGRGDAARSSLDEFLAACRTRGTLPHDLWLASPFFDDDATPNRAAEAVARQMARGFTPRIWLCVPGDDADGQGRVLLKAPRALYDTFLEAGAEVWVEIVPAVDDRERRSWHAKMIHAESEGYVALMAGSSNFTVAGLGLIPTRNAEANLVTIVDRVTHAREKGTLRGVWDAMKPVKNPDRATWQRPEDEEDEGSGLPVPPGFLAATFHAGVEQRIVLKLDPGSLPDSWDVKACGGLADGRAVLASGAWAAGGRLALQHCPWEPAMPPERLRVEWYGVHAFLPLNVADAMGLPAPTELDAMSADDMLAIIAASDPGAAIRAWTIRHREPDHSIDDDLDSATPIDLDPLSRYRLGDTFLHRVRKRARVMVDLRRFVEKPAATEQVLEWRLRGLIGIKTLAEKLAAEFEAAGDTRDPREALLTLADLLIVLREARYEAAEGAISKVRFTRRYQAFLAELAEALAARVSARLEGPTRDVAAFWKSVVERCRA